MNHDMISVRPLEEQDIQSIIDYFLNADEHFLHGMGVDPQKLPERENWVNIFKQELLKPLSAKKHYYIIWLENNKAVGHSSLTSIVYKKEAYMHLHIWDASLRKQGLGTNFIRLSLKHYFDDLQFSQLYCEPYALNAAPHRVLEKVGFDFIHEYVTTPGWVCFEQPVKKWFLTAEKFHTQALLQPHLQNENVSLVPLTVDSFEALYQVASDPLIWEQHPSRYRYLKNVFASFFKEAMDTQSAFLIYDNHTGDIIGTTRYYALDMHNNSIAIGFTFLSRAYWGGAYNKSVKELMLQYAFSLVENVIFHIGENNIRSQKAIEKIGAINVGKMETPPGHSEKSVHLVYRIRKKDWIAKHQTQMG
jgi:RimJ/RimL family protein N-acetyltransferase